MRRDELLTHAGELHVGIDVAADALQMHPQTAYKLRRLGKFPVRVIRIGGRYRVPTEDLFRFLGIDQEAA